MRRCLAAVVRLPLPLLLLLAAVETASGFSFSAVPNASWFISKARHGVREFVGKTPSTFAGKTAGSYSNEAGFRWLGLMSGSSDDVEIPEEHVLQVKIAPPPPKHRRSFRASALCCIYWDVRCSPAASVYTLPFAPISLTD